MSNLLNSIRYFSAEPAVRNLYKNQDEARRDEVMKQERLAQEQNRGLGALLAQGRRSDAAKLAFNMGRINEGIKLSDRGQGQKQTALVQNLIAAGLKPGSKEFRDAVLGGTKRGTVINNHLPGSEKGTNKLTEKLAEQAAGVFDQAASAQDLANKYSQINEFAQDPNVRTGTLGALELGVKKLGNTVFGLDFEGLPEAEQIQKVGDLLVGDIRKMQGDTRMSDADRRAYRAIPPNIGDSKQGILLATKIMQKTAEGMAKRQEVLSGLVSQNGGRFDTGVWAQYNRYINQNPILSREDVLKARSISKSAKQNTPGAGMNIEKLKSKYGLE